MLVLPTIRSQLSKEEERKKIIYDNAQQYCFYALLCTLWLIIIVLIHFHVVEKIAANFLLRFHAGSQFYSSSLMF